MERLKRSIPIKICLTILVVEAVLLTAMGVFYSLWFSEEIDARIAEKLRLPAILMNQRVLPYDAVKDFEAMGELVQEHVVEAFIFQNNGEIFFTADSDKEGKLFRNFLLPAESDIHREDSREYRQVAFTGRDGVHYLSSMTPLYGKGGLLGGLYVRISAEQMASKKRNIVWFFCLGGVLTIALSTILEAFVVYRMFVPRISHATKALQQYAGGDFSSRITATGAEDQLGELMRLVNFLMETIARNTQRLQALNRAGEALALAQDREAILAVAVAVLEKELPVRVMTGAGAGLFSLPLGESGVRGRKIVKFIGHSGLQRLDEGEASFVHALSGLMESALHRIDAFTTIARAEEKYRDLYESALEGILRADKNGRIEDVNPSMAVMTGYASAAEMIGANINVAELYAEPQGRDNLLELLKKNDAISDYEVYLKRRDGSIYPASVNTRALKNSQGNIEYVESRVVDISGRKLQEQKKQKQLAAEAAAEARLLVVKDLEVKNQELRDTLDELKNAQLQLIQSEKMAAVGMTAGGVAHDLNNILAGVVSYPELLLTTLPADSQLRKPLKAILASGKRAAAVVADLLTLAQGIARVRQYAGLDGLVEEYLQSVEFRQMMRAYPDVQVHWHGAADKAFIDCSPVHIVKVIMNLVMNGVEAVAPRGGSVHLRSWQTAEDNGNGGRPGGLAVLEVRDDGPGIPPESRDHIFEPFYTRKVLGKKGTGLGLTVVWNVIREHDGKIEVDCDGAGTAFRVFLPLAGDGPVDTPLPVEEGELRGHGLILVVDDEPLQRDIAEKMLTSFGFEVATAASGEEAVAFLEGVAVDLVLLDMLMPPGINGLETYRRILDIHPRQKALVVSGFSESGDVREAAELGAGGFLKKPYSMAQLAKAVKEELARR